MKRKVNVDLQADIWNLLEHLQTVSQQYVFDYQEHYITLLKLLFNKDFRETIKELRENFKVPVGWYDYPRNKRPHHKELFSFYEAHSEAPKKPTDAIVVDTCSLLGLNSLRYGWFILYYLYYADVAIGKDRSESLIAKGEYRHKARFVIQTNNRNKKQFSNNQRPVAYIEFFSDTNPNGIEELVKNNFDIIYNLKKVLSPFPHQSLTKFHDLETCKRDIEIFLLYKLGLKYMQIQLILEGRPTSKTKEILRKSFEELSDGKILFSQKSSNLGNSKKYNLIGYETIKSVVRKFPLELQSKSGK